MSRYTSGAKPSGGCRSPRRWIAHAAHAQNGPYLIDAASWASIEPAATPLRFTRLPMSHDLVQLDGSHGEGGGQILRTALTLSLVTGRGFRLHHVRANRQPPGLRPQHAAAVKAATELGNASVEGGDVGSRELTFRPGQWEPRDVSLDVGTAGATTLIMQTLVPALLTRAGAPVHLALIGGTFNDHAPSFPFLRETWADYLARMGARVVLTMPAAGFYPFGGGRLEAWVEPHRLRALTLEDRGSLVRIRGVSGVANIVHGRVAERMQERALAALGECGIDAEIELVKWPSRGQGAALALTAECEHARATFVGLGRRGKRAEVVAEEAVAELLDYLEHAGAVDEHSADQLLVPLALAEGASRYTVTRVTEHLRTNAHTIGRFLDRRIVINEASPDAPVVTVE